ncbi:DUF2851 family protein [Riemerella columbipharyngis]|uniref:DUF2851 domain-containing protein n=1 Tax=Riemerella columbipharyngis TaxID=1071918 RepID=A0A1G7D0Y9_9FLAO|nr:DUF2851 family protein [Riemerella columbipharyngis]SDE44586.1 Protein of unknown function [Riemerella columbipharyngis]
MNESLLQYFWNYKIFKSFDFKDTEGNVIEIMDFGEWNLDAGPDFLFAKIKTKNLCFVGNIELHLKSSDYLLHKHHLDKNFGNLILHAVYEHDRDIPHLVRNHIPTLELKSYIEPSVFEKYKILSSERTFIPCTPIFDKDKVPFQFAEHILLKKLEEKADVIAEYLKRYRNNYEAVLFHLLAYAFGLKVNAPIFLQTAQSVEYAVINKIRQNKTQLEALFYGISGWLNEPLDETMEIWKKEFDYLRVKFQLPDITITPKFLRLRPPNFPTIRFSQLASLYHRHQNLFSKLVKADDLGALYQVFEPISASEYWDNRYSFGKITAKEYPKILSKDFIHLILLNVVLPFKYAYYRDMQEDTPDKILSFYEKIPVEKNSIISEWKKMGLRINNALESQALLFHHKNSCSQKKCLNCGIGYHLLKT